MSFVTRYLEPSLVERLNHLQLSARSVVEGSITGLHRSPVKGASVEFRQHRFYTPGDEIRHLDWRVLGRTDRPYIKEYDEETNLRCLLMLDTSGSMGYGPRWGTKFNYGAKLIASLAYLMLGQSESVGLAMWSKQIDQWVAPKAGTSQLSRVIESLERAAPKGEGQMTLAMQQAADRLGKRSLVIVVSDAFTPVAKLRPGLARLRHDRHETIVLRVLDPDELTFPFRTWSRFRGLEGERAQLCEPALMRKSYLQAFRQHRVEFEDTCRALGVEHYAFTSDKPVIDSVTTFLQRREKRSS